MKNEADFKNVFCKSVEKQGGYTFKIAMSTVSGLPDLYCAMPGYAPVLLEAKWIKDCGPTFKRKIPYRPLQRDILNSANKASINSHKEKLIAYGLVGVEYYDGNKFCVLMPPQVQIISEEDIFRIGSRSIVNGEIDIERLFNLMVPKLCIQPADHENVTCISTQV